MKKLSFLTAALVLLLTANCNNGTNANVTNSSDDAASDGTTANLAQVPDTMEMGKLYFVNLKEGELPVMTGLSLYGNRCGGDDINYKPFATEGIRSVFELNEWIAVRLDTDTNSGLSAVIVPHQKDLAAFSDNS